MKSTNCCPLGLDGVTWMGRMMLELHLALWVLLRAASIEAFNGGAL
jgi:hypothetical protein